MPDITVNIRGNADQLKRELGDVGNTPNQPVGNSNQPINYKESEVEMRQGVREREDEVANKYEERRRQLEEQKTSRLDKVDENIERERKERLSNMGTNAQDPLSQRMLAKDLEKKQGTEYDKIFEEFRQKEEELNQGEGDEKSQIERDLTEALRELSEQYERQLESQTSKDSYLGQMRSEKRELIEKREGAKTEEEALVYRDKIKHLDEKIKDAEGKKERSSGSISAMGIMQGSNQFLNSMQQGNLGGMSSGAFGVAASSSANEKLAERIAQVGFGVSAAIGALEYAAKTYEAKSDLASSRITGNGYAGDWGVTETGNRLNSLDYRGVNANDLGMNDISIGERAKRRMDISGTATNSEGQQNWFDESIKGVGLENSLNLKDGALLQGSQFDRYGKTVTDAVTQMVDKLEDIKDSGVSVDDFTRVQEKFDIQQQIMGGQMGRTDKPDYDSANKVLAAFSSVKGITQDKRIGGDIQQMQSAIQNPMNDRMRALVFSTVQEIMPETQGRMDLTDRAIKDPKNEAKIMQAVMERITKQFGGTDTQMGYFAMKSIFPNIAPERMDAYQKGMTGETETTQIMKGQAAMPTSPETIQFQDDLLLSATETKAAITELTNTVISLTQGLSNKLSATTNKTNPQKPTK